MVSNQQLTGYISRATDVKKRGDTLPLISYKLTRPLGNLWDTEDEKEAAINI